MNVNMKSLCLTSLQSFKSLIFIFCILTVSVSVKADQLALAFTDTVWTSKGIPEGQQCHRFKGVNPQSPELIVKNIPAEATAIILEFSDRSFANMDKGGHGKVGYKIEKGVKEMTIPRIPGHTDVLPENFFIVAHHKAPGWDTAGAYLPPCSGGRGNQYFIDAKAVILSGEDVSNVISQASIQMATY
ncbi:MAG: hypothetical protein ACRBCS_06305 [Cellvibrionaceae bacterium]